MSMFQAKAAQIAAAVAVAAGVAVVGYFLSSRSTPEPETALVTPQPTAVVDKAEPVEPAATAPATPSFDEVRRDPDGMTVVAGRAAPGSQVMVISNGVEIASTKADNAGKFAALAILPPDGKGQVLSLEALGDGALAVSQEEVILAPLKSASVDAPTAEIEPEPVVAKQTEPPSPTDEPAQMAQSQAADPAPAPPAPAPPAPAAPATEPAQQMALLKSTPEGVELLASPSPEVTGNIALDTITYSETGDVRLAGRAQIDGASVQVYLDNRSVGKLIVDDQGRWLGDIDDIDTGIYTLRVDELNEAGNVISRVETPFKRESPDVLARATENYDGPISAVTVQEGATLWAIARERYGDPMLYLRVVEANRDSIRDPDLIYPGQVFSLPD